MIPTRTAASGFTLPTIGLGTYKLNGRPGAQSVAEAIRLGYRLIDSAFNYENEGAVGAGLRESGVPREELIVTSKLPGRHHGFSEAITAVEESVFRLGVEYADLYLIHWPNPLTDRYVDAWKGLIEARARGLVRDIGVCNFLPDQLARLERETGVVPAVNQIELHPYFPQADTLAYDDEHGIITESWSPLGRGNDLLANPVVVSIAESLQATPGQVVLAWHIARGAVPIPKASSPSHQEANLASVSVALTDQHIEAISALGRPDGRLAGQDPAVYEEF